MLTRLGIEMKVTCSTNDVLARLRGNKAQHQKMVVEAREGYLAKAHHALLAKLQQIADGKVVPLGIPLHVPADFSNVYDTAIGMLSAHTGETVALGADEYRHLMEDVWDWSDQFAKSNSQYSEGTRAYAAGKGFGGDQ